MSQFEYGQIRIECKQIIVEFVFYCIASDLNFNSIQYYRLLFPLARQTSYNKISLKLLKVKRMNMNALFTVWTAARVRRLPATITHKQRDREWTNSFSFLKRAKHACTEPIIWILDSRKKLCARQFNSINYWQAIACKILLGRIMKCIIIFKAIMIQLSCDEHSEDRKKDKKKLTFATVTQKKFFCS